MLLEVLEKIDKGKKTVIATVAEGSFQGYRCVLAEDEVVFEEKGSLAGLGFSETETAFSELRQYLKEEMKQVEKTCYKEIIIAGSVERVFFEVLSAPSSLIVCGGGHVAQAIVKLAKLIKLPVTVIEDRPLFANQIREAQADEVICDSFEHGLAGIESDSDTYFVIVTRGHRFDKVCLERILKKPYAYVGMMGSRSRIKLLKETMIEEGWELEKLKELHAPIGLDIHSETPEEIAVSILSEIISIKNMKKRSEGFSEEIKEGLKRPGEKILATIVMRKGSAPRQIGTKMVIFEDGTTKGTIGGGCAEAELIRTARLMLAEWENDSAAGTSTAPRLVRVNMTNQEAEDEGMVCGGIQDVFLEVVK